MGSVDKERWATYFEIVVRHGGDKTKAWHAKLVAEGKGVGVVG